ncbi:MAG TPA: VWA domain-containing protein [Polyangia bacterium]|nr:VWA domain-containing protein [Polyangia bacterium]
MRSAGLVVALCALGGCAGLKLQLVDASVRKPSNVAVYFTVDTKGGEPVADLSPQDFRIYEDGDPVSILESKQTILQEEVAAIHYTLLLVDMSGSVVDSGDMPALVQAASSFADRVGPYQKVAVYTFDGSARLTPLVGFGGNARAGIAALANRRPLDPSTNLNGAVVEGVRVLSQQMERAPVPLRFGTLVVFTDGTDRAHRASADDVTHALDGAGFETYAIGVGQEIDGGQLRRIGRSGTFASANRGDIQKGFDDVAARIEASSKRYYLLSYCSPSRAGAHDVDVEARARGTSGRLRYRFDANGFGPRCDPNQRPSFDVHHPRAVPPDRAVPERERAAPTKDAPPSGLSR